ncbi:hypothetical protein [Orrella marina]|nr:hypothetical protein [Orrella marina]
MGLLPQVVQAFLKRFPNTHISIQTIYFIW